VAEQRDEGVVSDIHAAVNPVTRDVTASPAVGGMARDLPSKVSRSMTPCPLRQ
jgi:hypothetical protein